MKVKIETDDGRTLTGELTEVEHAFKVGQRVIVLNDRWGFDKGLEVVITGLPSHGTYLYDIKYPLNGATGGIAAHDIAPIEDEPVEKPKRGRWAPEYREQYETIDRDGDVFASKWFNDSYDQSRLAIGNVYRIGEAEKQVERLRAIVRINDWIAENCEESTLWKHYVVINSDNGIYGASILGTMPHSIDPVVSLADFDRLKAACADDLEIVMNAEGRDNASRT